ARCHPLFQSPGIAAVLEHLEVMVRLEHQAIGAADAVEHMGRKVAKIGDEGDAHAFGAEAERQGVGRVVGHGKRRDLDVPDSKADSSANGLDPLQRIAGRAHGRARALVQINRRRKLGGKARQSGDVIGMLVGDEHPIELLGGAADELHAPQQFLSAEPGVEQEAGARGGQDGGVSATAAAENREGDQNEARNRASAVRKWRRTEGWVWTPWMTRISIPASIPAWSPTSCRAWTPKLPASCQRNR